MLCMDGSQESNVNKPKRRKRKRLIPTFHVCDSQLKNYEKFNRFMKIATVLEVSKCVHAYKAYKVLMKEEWREGGWGKRSGETSGKKDNVIKFIVEK